METIDILRRYTAAELRQMSVYLEEFQGYTFIAPENTRQKKCWLNSLNSMFSQKELEEPEQYIARIKVNIRWFINHKIKFQRGMGTGEAFYDKIVYGFVRNITDTVIHFEDRLRNSIDIPRTELILCDDIMNTFNRCPNNLNKRNFYADQRQQQPTVSIWSEIINLIDDGDFIPNIAQVQSTTVNPIVDEEVTDDTRLLECKVCMTNKICIVLTNCGHTFCHTCTTRIDNKCATCRKPFTNSTKVRMYI
jgi:hypothetical protein